MCKDHDLPIVDAVAPLEVMGNWCALQVDTDRLTDLKTNSNDFCRQLGNIAFNNKSSMLVNRILLFGPDIDVYNFKDILWAMATRCRPGQDEYVFEDIPGFPLTPYMSHGNGNPKRGGKIISDCLFPMEYEGKKTFSSVDFKTSYPPEIQEKVKAHWTKMGFEDV